MKSEIHLFLVWDNARHKIMEIDKDINTHFDVLHIDEIQWEVEKFSDNLSRFYGKNLPPNCKKQTQCGTGPFVLYVVRDNNPKYDVRKTTKGLRTVNVNTFDAKIRYRKLVCSEGKEKSLVHASNNIPEAIHDLILITGKPYSYYDKMSAKKSEKLFTSEDVRDLMGTDGWRDFRELLCVMNECMTYVILRNFENFLETPLNEEHTDIDILVANYDEARRLLNAMAVHNKKFRVQNKVIISGKEFFFDIRYVGDGYLDVAWQQAILANRKILNKSYYIPCNKDYFYSLLYHALINKNSISADYQETLVRIGKTLGIILDDDDFKTKLRLNNLLLAFLLENGYSMPEPSDISVGFYELSGNKKVLLMKRGVRKKIAKIEKKLSRKLAKVKTRFNGSLFSLGN